MSAEDSEHLLRRAHELSEGPLARGSDQRWDVVVELHGRAEELVFERCVTWSESSHAFERTLAADILGQLGYVDRTFPFRERTIAILSRLLTDAEPLVLQSALIAVGHLGIRVIVEQVRGLARHPDPEVRHAVVLALLEDESPASVLTLIGLSRDEDKDVRDWATFGLGSQMDLDTPEVREALLARAADAELDIRAEALAGLVKRHDPRVLAPLCAALESGVVGTVEIEAARDLGVPELVGPLEKLRGWWDVDPELLEEALTRCRPSS